MDLMGSITLLVIELLNVTHSIVERKLLKKTTMVDLDKEE